MDYDGSFAYIGQQIEVHIEDFCAIEEPAKGAMKRTVLCLLVAICLAKCGLAQTASVPESQYKIEETRLGSWEWDDVTPPPISADGRHVAYATRVNCHEKESKMCLLFDGQSSAVGRDTFVANLIMSPDGKRIAYSAWWGKNVWVAVDGKPRDQFETAGGLGGSVSLVASVNVPLLFSPDGKRIAYGGNGRMFVDGLAGRQYSTVNRPTFSSDSKHVAYLAQEGNVSPVRATDAFNKRDGSTRWFLVTDGQEVALDCDAALGPVFSPDGKQEAYLAQRAKKWSLIVDGQAGPAYDDIYISPSASTPFSPDGRHVAYSAKRDGKWLVVVDGEEKSEHDEIGVGTPSFSPDGKRLAFSFRTGRSDPWKLIVDDQPAGEYREIFYPSFSPDGKHLAFAAVEQGAGNMSTMVVDGQPGSKYYRIGSWAFSPDSKHLAYAAQTSPSGLDRGVAGNNSAKWSVSLDGRAGNEYDIVLPNTLVFDPDGALEFLAVKKEGHSFLFFHGSLYHVRYTPTP